MKATPLLLRVLAPGLLVLLGSGCASRQPPAVTQLSAPGCDARWNLEPAAVLQVGEAHERVHRFDSSSRCLAQSDGGASRYAVFRLPRFREDWTLRIDSQISGRSLFAPEALLLDAEGRVLRELPFERFSLRGDRLQATVFFSGQNADEQYLLLRSARQAVGRDERRVESGSFVIPLITGLLPLVYMQGTESEGTYTYSHGGLVRLEAHSSTPAPRRGTEAGGIARTQIGYIGR